MLATTLLPRCDLPLLRLLPCLRLLRCLLRVAVSTSRRRSSWLSSWFSSGFSSGRAGLGLGIIIHNEYVGPQLLPRLQLQVEADG